MNNDTFYSQQKPIIEYGKLVLISNGGSREIIGIRGARKQLRDLESKTDIRPSTAKRLQLLREAVAMWDNR